MSVFLGRVDVSSQQGKGGRGASRDTDLTFRHDRQGRKAGRKEITNKYLTNVDLLSKENLGQGRRFETLFLTRLSRL